MDKVIDVITGGLTTTKVDEAQIRWQNGLVGKLHALTGSLLFLFSITVFAKELLGDHIRCTRSDCQLYNTDDVRNKSASGEGVQKD